MTQQGITLENIKTVLEPSGGQNMQITKQTIGMHLGENKYQQDRKGVRNEKRKDSTGALWWPK